MTIPERQLETWSHQGAIKTASQTAKRVKRVLGAYFGSSLDYDVYLQGSYGNDTNIYGNSDVDVVAQLNSTFLPHLASRDPAQREAFRRTFRGGATYRWEHFRANVVSALKREFGRAVTEGRKCIKVAGDNARLPCDVVPCLEYRYYTRFPAKPIPGIVFWTKPEGREVVNFPEPHYENGVGKQKETSDWFKPMVRVFKNARDTAARRGYLPEGVAPSYFLECFVYNAPRGAFGGSFQSSFCDILNWWNDADLSSMKCQNGVTPLFGATPEQWSEAAAKHLIVGLANLWNHW